MALPPPDCDRRRLRRHLVRLPLADLPATVLPGAVITLALGSDQLRRAIETAGVNTPTVRLVLASRRPLRQLGVVAQVPDIGDLPTGEPVAIVRVESVPASPPSPRPSGARPTPTSRSSPTRGRRHADRGARSASCAPCSRRSPSCAARAGCPRCCARRRARRPRRRRRHVGRPRRGPPARRCSSAVRRRPSASSSC